ncbi:MAG: PepSY-like domain-containing protein [Bacteroidales bacterium]|nr:PepSY-like domain-containing protein [Bacteroidales bacterium]
MKRLVLIFAALLTFAAVSGAAVKSLNFEKLPIQAQEYVKSNVPDLSIALIKKDGSEFDVVFANGMKISFDKKGVWRKIKCKKYHVDERLIPALIREKVNELYPGSRYEKIEKDGKNFEVELVSGIELTFNSKYKLTHIDD